MSEIPAYEREPRCPRLETSVVETGEDGGRPFVVLADTILYPEGGGQPSDRGTIDGIPVLDVQKQDGVVRHVLDGGAPAGEVAVELDWSRRFDHMQQHTAQHLLTAIAEDRFGWATTAFHLGDRVSDIELDAVELTPGDAAALEEAVAEEIRAARAVGTRRVTREEYVGMRVRSRGLPAGHVGSVRLVEIDGVDLNTCGGTHCASTAELEALKLLGTESVRGGTRLFFVAGGRVRRLLGEHHDRNARLRGLLGVPDEQLETSVETKLDQLKAAHREARALEEELALACAAALAAGPERFVVAHWPGRDLPFLQRVAREVDRIDPQRVVFLTSGEGDEGAFLIGAGESASFDVSAAGARVVELLAGRGGGSGRVFQGRATALSRRDEAVALLE